MTQEPTVIPAPELEGGTCLNGEPLTIASLRGRPVLIDFWDYTCINCLRSLPYLKEWHRRYSPHGLVVIGVHAPEFSFGKSEDHVRRAVQELGIEYPVVLDNDFKIWRAYANQYWPAKYLVEATGNLRGRPGNPAGLTPDRPAAYRDPGKHAEGFFYLEGPWLLAGEYLARPVGADGERRVSVRFPGEDVN